MQRLNMGRFRTLFAAFWEKVKHCWCSMVRQADLRVQCEVLSAKRFASAHTNGPELAEYYA